MRGVFMTKIQKIISLLFSYRTNVFSLVSKPKQTYNYTKFVMQLKYIYGNEADKTDAAFSVLNEVLKFKKENPQDFEELILLLKIFVETYEKEPEHTKHNIKEILK